VREISIMRHPRSEAELVTLRKFAQELATTRKETLTTVHLLAAMAAREDAAAELLRERRLDQDALVKAARSFDEDGPDPIGRAIVAARDLVRCGPSPEPTALHVLLALLANRRSAAHRALVQSGVDIARLRTSAMQQTLGVVAARRGTGLAQRASADSVREPEARRSTEGPGVTVPWIPSPNPPARKTSPPPSRANDGAPPPSPAASSSFEVQPPSCAPSTPRRAAPRRVSAQRTASSVPHGASSPKPGASIARFELDRKQFPTLSSLGRNLTMMAADGALGEVFGRDDEIERALDVLAKRHANSPCLVGPPGVGKTAVARGLAQRFAQAPESDSAPRLLIELAVSELVAGTSARGALSERLAAVRSEVREAEGRVVLFIDELQELFGGGWADEAAGELKLALARGELSIVGATTPEEHRRVVEGDALLARRFTIVEIDEPNEADAFLVLQRVTEGLGQHHAVVYAPEAIAAAVSWSIRYLPGRALPDKAVSILDLAGARVKRRRASQEALVVGPEAVAEVVAELAEVPVERLLETDRERMLSLETLFGDKVVGHASELARIATILRRNAAGLRSRRPIGSFLLLGPTGVGKTETAKAIAEALFHSPDAMTRLDLSEYAEPHAIARLVGAPPGYVGHEAGGQLTEAVRRRPYQVVLLDEIEKAHRDVLEAFLQVFDEGRMTDGRGRRVDFTNTVIVLTSNLGAAEAGAVRQEKTVGFARAQAASTNGARAMDAMHAAAKSALPPELYNRLDEVLCYASLTRPDVAEIARRLLRGLEASLEARGVRLDVEPAAIDALLDHGGFDPEYGARPMKRAIARLIEAPLAEMLLRGELGEGSVALVGVDAGVILVDSIPA
jgi:ATP-dependent Clp protease ATP-binding subunit ClpC